MNQQDGTSGKSVEVVHANFGWLHAPPLPPACCHGLIIRSATGVVLVDPGIGLEDIANPGGRIGEEVIQAAGFQFLPTVTAVHQLAALGIEPTAVTDIVLTHGDPDHVGGLADFPAANIHLALEEKANLESGNPRYCPLQFAHGPKWVTYGASDDTVLGLPARRVALPIAIYLIPLFGHTLGHCGVALRDGDAWLLHVGDAYYLRAELDDEQHPVGELATLRADDNPRRLDSLQTLRQWTRRADVALTYFGYHDVTELPPEIPQLADLVD